jgi:hypothetical protein
LAEIVKFRLARKRKAREASDRAAAERRVQFGQLKSEMQAEAKRRDLSARTLEGHRRDGADET